MKCLLDTQVWLWLLTRPERVAAELRGRLAEGSTQLLLSAASSWESAIKHALGSLDLPEPPRDFVPSRMRSSGVDGLQVSHAHALQVATLPHHHGDPFDRLLVAQAQVEDAALVTADQRLERYDVAIIRAS